MSADNRPPPYSMRLDPELRQKLEEAASVAGRSLHAEISMRLETSLQAGDNTLQNFTEAQARVLIAEAMEGLLMDMPEYKNIENTRKFIENFKQK